MNFYWLEFFNYIFLMLAILVCVSSGSLFLLTFRVEKKLRTVWRIIGFFTLAAAYLMFLLERKYPGFDLPAFFFELLGFFSICKGVMAEPKLSHLRQVEESKEAVQAEEDKEEKYLFIFSKKDRFVPFVAAILLIIFGAIFFYWGNYLPSIIILVTIVFVVMTIRIQVRRYRTEGRDLKTRRQNLWPMLSFIFLLIREFFMVFDRLPADIKFKSLRAATEPYSFAWQAAVYCGIIGFVFLAIWAWTFIKLRIFLRTYVVFLVIAITVSSLGSLVFTTLIFNIIESNNLDQMMKGVKHEELIMAEKQNGALFMASSISNDQVVISAFVKDDSKALSEAGDKYFKSADLGILRFISKDGEVIASPSDPRDRGRLFNKDPMITYAITQKKHLKTYDVIPDVLSPKLVARAIAPVLNGDNVVGAIEAGYLLDDAFVDYSKQKTNSEVTIFADRLRSATTLVGEDNKSRWKGSLETDSQVLTKVLGAGQSLMIPTHRLGQSYYTAYAPIRDINSKILGMVAVGSLTQILFENTRQELVSTFLIVSIISLLAALIGYIIIRSFDKKRKAKQSDRG